MEAENIHLGQMCKLQTYYYILVTRYFFSHFSIALNYKIHKLIYSLAYV